MQHWHLRTLEVPPRQPQVLQSDRGDSRSILINLPAGERLQEHQVHERAHVIVVEGEVEFDCAGEVVSGGVGTFVVFEPRELHELRAKTDSRVLLILAPWPGSGHPGARDD